MDGKQIPYTRVPKSSALLVDYLYHHDRVASFFNGSPFEIESYGRVARQLGDSAGERGDLVEILRRQNDAFGCGEATAANIKRLAEPATFAVVTGQQVGLLSGPAFTLYKALTAVRLAQHLSEQGLPCVPVFWLATEDHDLEEVAAAAALDEEYNLVRLEDAGERPAPRCSVGFVKLSTGIDETLRGLEASLPSGEPRNRLLDDLRGCYEPGATWGKAFGRFMARLFSRWGVVLLDPLDDSVHRLCLRLFGEALARARALRERLTERSLALVRAGYHAQVHIADDSTLLFANQERNRTPVTESDGQSARGFLLGDAKRLTLEEMTAWFEAQPLDFSPNVLFRPFVQDSLLPTLAYVAGPSELAYLGQAQVLYSEFGRPMPVVFPRAAFTLVDRRVQRLLEKYHLSVEDVWEGEERLNRRIAAVAGSGSESWAEHFDRGQQELTRVFERLRQDVEGLDATLVDAVTHGQEKVIYQLERLRGKVSRAALQRSDLLTRHEQALLRSLTPRRNLQEREVSGVSFLGRAGYELLERLLEEITLDRSEHTVMVY